MSKAILEAVKEVGPIGDGHTSERIWVSTGNGEGHYVEYYKKLFADKLGIDVDKMPDDLYVHHIDGDRMNNDIDNLMLGTKKAHERLEQQCFPEKYSHEND